jgi:dipeptidyl aminopeptidase/acylaminoacyl peptidase
VAALRLLVVVLCVCCAAPAADAEPPSVGLIFSEPALENPKLSPDGNQVLFIRRPQAGDESQAGAAIIIADFTDMDAPTGRRIPMDDEMLRWATWANNDRILFSWQVLNEIDGGGTLVFTADNQIAFIQRAWRTVLLSSNLDGSDPVQILEDEMRGGPTLAQIRMDQVVDFLPNDPDHILISSRHPRSGRLNVYRVNIWTGEGDQIDSGRDDTLVWFTNGRGETVLRIDLTHRPGRARVMIRPADGHRWRTVATHDLNRLGLFDEDITWVARAEAFDEALVLARPASTNTLGVYRYSLAEGEILDPVFSNPDYDVASVAADPFTGRALAINWSDEHRHVEVFDPIAREHLPALRDFFSQEVAIIPIQRAGTRMLLSVSGPREPQSYYLYDWESRRVAPIGARQPELHRRALARVSTHRYQASDGTALFGYLTHPVNADEGALPLVVLPHGGPQLRDYYEFDPIAQIIAAEGYLVFQPQFRGSDGFGSAFREAGFGQWDGLIQSDIREGVESLVNQQLVDPERICVAGWSFGGYAALMQAIEGPELYRCAAAGAAVTAIPELIAWSEESRPQATDSLLEMVATPDIDRQRAASPVNRAGEVEIPILLVHGTSDDIVPVEQSRLMEQALIDAGLEERVELVEFDGGHALNVSEEMLTAMFHITRFLNAHLDQTSPQDAGPRAEP